MLLRQNPYFVVEKELLTIPFGAGSKLFRYVLPPKVHRILNSLNMQHLNLSRRAFSLDLEAFNEIQEHRRQIKSSALAVHVRLISSEKRDVGWDHTFNLTCNHLRPDLSKVSSLAYHHWNLISFSLALKNEKKIRQLKMQNPFITPLPADITALIHQATNNVLEFSIYRPLSGVAVVQLVRKVTTDQVWCNWPHKNSFSLTLFPYPSCLSI